MYELVFMSEIQLESQKGQNYKSLCQRQEGMKHKNFISGAKIYFDLTKSLIQLHSGHSHLFVD